MAQQVSKTIRTPQGVDKIGALRWEQIKGSYLNNARRFHDYEMCQVLADYYEFAQHGEQLLKDTD